MIIEKTLTQTTKKNYTRKILSWKNKQKNVNKNHN